MHSAFTAIYFIAKAKRNWKAWISRQNHQVLDLKSVLNLEHSTHTGIHTKFGTCSLYTLVPRYGRTVVIRHNELYDFLFWGCWAIRSRSRIRNWPWCRIILQGGRFSTERWFFADVSRFRERLSAAARAPRARVCCACCAGYFLLSLIKSIKSEFVWKCY